MLATKIIVFKREKIRQLQHIVLWLCVLSIWLPGSPFDPIGYFKQVFGANSADVIASAKTVNGTLSVEKLDGNLENPKISIIFFFTGISLARYGLFYIKIP